MSKSESRSPSGSGGGAGREQHRWPRRVLVLAVVLGLLGLLWFSFTPSPIPVDAAEVVVAKMQVSVEQEGEVRCVDRYTIAAPVTGRLLRVAVREGDPVKLGDPVATIRPVPLDARQRDEAGARLMAARAATAEADAQLRRTQVEATLAASERARTEALVSREFLAAAVLEKAAGAQRAAAREVQAAQSRLVRARAEVRAAEAALEASDPSARPLVLEAPVAGVVLKVQERSERVLVAGSPIVTVGDPARLEAVVDVLTNDAVRIVPGAVATLERWGGSPAGARVRLVEPSAFTKVSALGVEEKRVNVLLDLDEVPTGLGDGYRVTARIVVWSGKDVVTVPVGALFRHGGEWAAFVYRQGRALRRVVRIGERNNEVAQVIEGLEPGDRVIVYPASILEDGARVSIRDDRG